MKRLLTGLSMLIFASSAFATPPTSMVLSYDHGKNALHISANHPSTYKEKHFIRRLVISKNGVEAQTSILNQQKIPKGLEEDIVFLASPGDRITVQAYCSKGGVGSAEFTVPAKPAEAKGK